MYQCHLLVNLVCLLLFFTSGQILAQNNRETFMDSISDLIREAGNNPKQILKLADSLTKKTQSEKNRYNYAGYLLVEGVAYSQLGKRTLALSDQTNAFAIFDSLQDDKWRAISLACIAFTNMELGNHKKAHYYSHSHV